jgi:hypothetical protein
VREQFTQQAYRPTCRRYLQQQAKPIGSKSRIELLELK